MIAFPECVRFGGRWLVLLAFAFASAASAQDLTAEHWEAPNDQPWEAPYSAMAELSQLDELSYDAQPDTSRMTAVDRSDWFWHFRPKGFVYSTYWASAAEPRMATHFVKEADQGWLLDSHIGGRVGIVRFGPSDRDEGWQLDVLGGAKLRQDWEDGLDVLATDFRYDILTTYGVDRYRFKFGFYHVSSHAGDEFLLKNEDFDRLNFYRDVLVAGFSYYPFPQLRFYGEAGWAFSLEVSEPWEFQFGIDYGPAFPTGVAGAPFAAINAHLREELDFGGNLAFQLGWAWRGEQADGVLRTGLYYYDGHSPQFSFYAQHEQQLGWGLWYDY
ncbi:MAG: DUF1207 domain-containing protein [Pirellulaceae bacterium]|nr:DUF1207 domain-containing protein [Pirellulaceae bacterium]